MVVSLGTHFVLIYNILTDMRFIGFKEAAH